MTRSRWFGLPLVAGTFVLAAGAAMAAPPTTMSTESGDILVGEGDMTLYTFRNDEEGESYCYDRCAENWPPFIAAEGDTAEAPYSLVEREDGSMQWALNGMPLYYWVNDSAPGDVTGDGVGGNWDLARP